jgi:hypothetical protein
VVTGAVQFAAKQMSHENDPIIALVKYAFDFVAKMVEKVAAMPAEQLLKTKSTSSDAESSVQKISETFQTTSVNSSGVSVGVKRRRV